MTGPLKNARHERFAQELAKGQTADAAYAAAGFKPHRGNAARLSANENIRARVAEILAEAAAIVAIDASWVLRRLAEESNADVADLYDDEGKVKPIRQWPLIWRQGLVAGIETIPEIVGKDDDGNPIIANGYKLKLASRDKRLEMLGKHVYVSAFREQVDHTSSDGSMSPPSLADFYGGAPAPADAG